MINPERALRLAALMRLRDQGVETSAAVSAASGVGETDHHTAWRESANSRMGPKTLVFRVACHQPITSVKGTEGLWGGMARGWEEATRE